MDDMTETSKYKLAVLVAKGAGDTACRLNHRIYWDKADWRMAVEEFEKISNWIQEEEEG